MSLTFQGNSRSNVMVSLDCPYMVFLLMFNSNIGPNMAPLRDISLQNMSDLEFNLSRSLKVKCNGAVRLSIFDFLLLSNSNYMSNSHRLAVTLEKIFLSLIIRAKFRPNFKIPIQCYCQHNCSAV